MDPKQPDPKKASLLRSTSLLLAIPSLLVEGFTDEQGQELRDACTAA